MEKLNNKSRRICHECRVEEDGQRIVVIYTKESENDSRKPKFDPDDSFIINQHFHEQYSNNSSVYPEWEKLKKHVLDCDNDINCLVFFTRDKSSLPITEEEGFQFACKGIGLYHTIIPQ